MKARNVLFAADGTARLIDLTTACGLDSPAVTTTAAYGLPARGRGRAADADRFALAVLLFELSTGRLPYGPEGAGADFAEPPAVEPRDARAAGLLDAACAALRAGGRERLSYFSDVIESVRPAHI